MIDDNEEKKKGKTFKSIEDILNISSPNNSSNGNEEINRELEEKAKASLEAIKKLREEFDQMNALNDIDYSKTVLKKMIEKSMTMLAALETDIVENPTGRAIETAAAMVASINSLVDNFNKIGVLDKKMDLEERKFEEKKKQISGPSSVTQNNLFFGDSTSLLDMLGSKGILPSVAPKLKEVMPEIPTIKNDSEDHN
jgi:hypothetical protein